MGTFFGYIMPGTFLLMFALWWTVQTFFRYFQDLYKTGPAFRCTVTFPFPCSCGDLNRWEWEGFVKVVFSAIGIAGEVCTAYNDSGEFEHMINGQHASIFLFFGLSGLVDILVYHRLPLPVDLSYAMMILSFVVEALMFKFHLQGQTELEALVHMLLLYAVYGSILASLLEMRFRENVLSLLARAYFVLLQGTWYWQIAFVLYNPGSNANSWDESKQKHLILITMAYSWHMAIILFLVTAMGSGIGFWYHWSTKGSRQTSYSSLQSQIQPSAHSLRSRTQLMKKDSDGHTILVLYDGNDASDAEFEKSQEDVNGT